jgi:hypothetical protein
MKRFIVISFPFQSVAQPAPKSKCPWGTEKGIEQERTEETEEKSKSPFSQLSPVQERSVFRALASPPAGMSVFPRGDWG